MRCCTRRSSAWTRSLELFDDYPDVVISCIGGGSNFGGFALPFVADVLKKGLRTRFIAAQSEAAPNLQGHYEYDFADYAEMTPMLKMLTLGHRAEMQPVKGDGLRYHGCSPILSLLRCEGYIDGRVSADERQVLSGRSSSSRRKDGCRRRVRVPIWRTTRQSGRARTGG
jgi:tryptophan synthase beta chain